MSKYSDAVLALSPAAYWRLGEPLGTVALDQMWLDPGTYVGGVTLAATGAISGDVDTAVTFNGTTGSVTVLDSATLDFGNGPLSIIAWFKRADALTTYQMLWAKGTQGNLFLHTNKIEFDNNTTTIVTSSGTITDTSWHMVVLTRSAAGAGNTKLYLDGADVTTEQNVANTIASNATNLRLGIYIDGSLALNGSLDEVATFPAVHSAAQISRLYAIAAETTTTNRANLVAGITTMMSAFIAAHPTLLLRHFDARPKSVVTDWPCSYLDTLEMPELHWDSALRTTVFNPQIVFVFRETDPGETGDSIDALIDAMNDHLDAYPHIVAGTWWSDASWAEEAVPLSDTTSATGVRLTITGFSFANGRL